MAGGTSETKVAGKGDAIFGLELGMLLELAEKSQAKVNLGGVAGLGDVNQDMNIVHKYEMEQK